MKRTISLLLFLLCAAVLMTLSSAVLADAYTDLDPGLVTVVAQGTIPFRASPDDSAEPFLQIASGTSLTLLSINWQTNWAYAQLDSGPDGYPVKGYVRPDGLMNGDYLYWDMCRVVNPNSQDRLNLRSGPSADAPSLGKYYTGVLVQNYHQEENGYLRVCVGSQVGYMDVRYLTANLFDVTAFMPILTIDNKGGSGGNLRVSPSLGARPFGLYPNGTEVVVLGVTPNGWCHVMINGVTGFMMADKLSGIVRFDTTDIVLK